MTQGSKVEYTVKRRRIRFRPDPLDLAHIDSRPIGDHPFEPDTVAVIVDEDPLGGCGLVIVENGKLARGDTCVVRLGRLDPLRAEVRWRRTIDEDVVRIGLRFLQ
jgi:hypothetical protein